LNKDQAIGAAMLVGSALGIAVYGWLVYAFPTIVLQVTAFLAVAAVLVIVAWIGWTMATTPPLEPFEMDSTPSESQEAKSEEVAAPRE
jgi:predicted DNA-binding transcriptional regulator